MNLNNTKTAVQAAWGAFRPLLLLIPLLSMHCLEPQRFELDVNSPDGLLSFFGAVNTTSSTSSNTPGLTVSTTSLTLDETTGASQDYTIALSSAPTADVTLTLGSNSYLNRSPDTLTFTPANWNTPQTVRGQARNNFRRDLSGFTTTLTHTLSSSDTTFAGLSSELNVNITNDPDRLIFATATAYVGSLTGSGANEGFLGADEKCNADANKPAGSGVFKAFITGTYYHATSATIFTRVACLTANCTTDEVTGVANTDWVLAAQTEYVRPDGVLIGQTNGGRHFTLPLNNSLSTSVGRYWSGTQATWIAFGGTVNCNSSADSWNEGTNFSFGRTGDMNQTGSTALTAGALTCDNQLRLICAEQE